MGYKSIMDGTTPVPVSTATVKDEELKACIANTVGYTDSVLSIDDEVCFNIVDGAKTMDLPDGCLKMAFDKLKHKYESKTNTALIELSNEFQSSKLEKGANPEEWITKLEKTRKRLKFDFKAQGYEDNNLMIHILGNLTYEYDTLVNMLTKRVGASSDGLVLDELKEELAAKYSRLSKSKKSPKQEQALNVSDGGGNKDQKKIKGKC